MLSALVVLLAKSVKIMVFGSSMIRTKKDTNILHLGLIIDFST